MYNRGEIGYVTLYNIACLLHGLHGLLQRDLHSHLLGCHDHKLDDVSCMVRYALSRESLRAIMSAYIYKRLYMRKGKFD